MFHPERLTGKRRRKYQASISYAPQATKIPKHLLKVIRAPAHHVKYVKMVMPKILGARTAHHVAVIRQRIVMLNHSKETQSGEKAMAELSGTKDWRCTCYEVCEMYGTHTKCSHVYDEKRKRRLAHASTKSDLPEDMIALRLSCRRPVTTHRTVHLDKDRGFDQDNGDTARAPYVPPRTLEDKLIAAKLPDKIATRASEVLAAALGGGIRVEINQAPTDTGTGSCQLNIRSTAFAAAWSVGLDPYAWYSRVYYRGLHVLNDWFVTHVTRRHGTVLQQDGVDLLLRTYNTTPDELKVCQPATAVSLTWLRRPCTISGGRAADLVTGVIAYPFAGAAYFLPLPKWSADLWLPRVNRYHDVYTYSLNKTLAEFYTTAEARENAKIYADKLAVYGIHKPKKAQTDDDEDQLILDRADDL